MLTQRTMRSILISLIAGLAIYEGVALLDPTRGDTISVNTRELFHTDTRGGRIAWTLIYGPLAFWYYGHILKWHKLSRWN